MAQQTKGYRKRAGQAVGIGLLFLLILVPFWFLPKGCLKGTSLCWKHKGTIGGFSWDVFKFFLFAVGALLTLVIGDGLKALVAWLWGMVVDEYPTWGRFQLVRMFVSHTREALLDLPQKPAVQPHLRLVEPLETGELLAA